MLDARMKHRSGSCPTIVHADQRGKDTHQHDGNPKAQPLAIGTARPERRAVARTPLVFGKCHPPVAILLGLLTTAAISFSAAYWPPFDGTSHVQDFIVLDGQRHLFSTIRSFGLCTSSWHEEDRDTRFVPAVKGESVVEEVTSLPEPWSSIWSRDQRARTAAAVAAQSSMGCTDIRAGWPFKAFSGTTFQSGASMTWRRDGDVLFPPLRRWTSGPRAGRGQVMSIPLRPLPLGLSLDSVIFAIPWLVLLLAWGRICRFNRIRRGLCPHCRYDLGGTPPDRPCPECGNSTAHTSPPRSPTGSAR